MSTQWSNSLERFLAGAFGGRLQIDAPRRSHDSENDPCAAADAAVAAWAEIDALLAPVLGRRGVAAPYQRSVHLTLTTRPWLAPARDGLLQPGGLDPLHTALAAQDGATAAAASPELLANFRVLLASLLGESLTTRLLAPQQRAPPRGDAAKESQP
ncbi:hypothetical protein JJ685_21100 [Ramlibacter monticola]|uniref:Uncharacterized protein n=1 Tax=Ramlibacter monticola TaxID=1926872 RepID=A0A937CVF6_9BURK|nr:hypothetical protein [Ramlibacter monticola]MBL0393648.1 hypothetical protein [Ramlibacter monticola]